MNTKFAFFALLISMFSFSQSLEFGIGLGTGANYIVENSVNVTYKTPVSINTDLKYTPNNSNIGILLRYQYANTSVSGQKWFESNQPFTATVDDNSLFLLVEYLKRSGRKLNFGGNFGVGFTKQIIQFNSENYSVDHTFPSVNVSGIMDYNVSEKFALKLQPGFQFFDPINGMKSKPYNFAKEDIHFLTLLGIT
ncbi:MAG: hypothetical protein K0M56_03375 [Kaistella sp.]|nr:hypothetical protein [Kaistella sp.]